MSLNRRTLVRTGAWAVPVVALATTAPVFAVSGVTVVATAVAQKCPGRSNDKYYTTIITVTLTGDADSFSVSQATLNDQKWVNPCVIEANPSTWYIVLPGEDSEHGDGGANFTYSIDGDAPKVGAVTFDDNHPIHGGPCDGGC